MQFVERGNCARWTSKGLEKAGVLTRISMWPKSIWINMFENCRKTEAKSPANVSVVAYRRIRHAKMSYGLNADPLKAVAPLQSIRSLLYWKLESFASMLCFVVCLWLSWGCGM